MPIAELGYRPWEGRRTGRLARALAIARAEIGIAQQSSRLLRRFLIFAWLPILYFCPFFLAFGAIADPGRDPADRGLLTQIAGSLLPPESLAKLRASPEETLPAVWSIAFFLFFTYTQSLFSMVVVAIVGPPLIAKDLRSKAFLVYLSKPIAAWQYLLGKLATVGFFVLSMTLFPGVFLYLVGVALSPSLATAINTLPTLGQVVLASIAIAVPTGLLVLLLSTWTKDRRLATFTWVALWVFGEFAFRVLDTSARFAPDVERPHWAALLSLREMTTRTAAGIFDVRGSLERLLRQLSDSEGVFQQRVLEMAAGAGEARLIGGELDAQSLVLGSDGYPPAVFMGALLLLSLGSAIVVLRRAHRQVRI